MKVVVGKNLKQRSERRGARAHGKRHIKLNSI